MEKTDSIQILLTPQNGFYYEEGDENGSTSVVGFLRGVLEYQTTGDGKPARYWQYGSLRFTYQKTLPIDLTNSNIELIAELETDIKLRVTITFQVLGNMGNGLIFSLSDGSGAPAQLKIDGQSVDSYNSLQLETQTLNQAVSIFFSATKATVDVNPYFVFSILIAEH